MNVERKRKNLAKMDGGQKINNNCMQKTIKSHRLKVKTLKKRVVRGIGLKKVIIVEASPRKTKVHAKIQSRIIVETPPKKSSSKNFPKILTRTSNQEPKLKKKPFEYKILCKVQIYLFFVERTIYGLLDRFQMKFHFVRTINSWSFNVS